MAYFIAGQHHDYLAFLARDFGAFFGAVFFSSPFAISFNILSRKKNKSKNPWCWFFSLTLPQIMTRNFCLACLTRPSGSEKPASTASFLGWQDLHSIGHPWYLYMKFQAPTIYWDWKPIWPTPAVHTTIPHQIHPAKSHGIQQSLLGSLPNAVQGISRLALHALADLHNPSTLATDVFQQQILP